MMIRKVMGQMEFLYPSVLAESWDRCGLQVGNPDADTDGVLLCLDVDPPAVEAAWIKRCGLILSHHPLLFDPVTRIDESTPSGRLLSRIIRGNLTVFSAHTNLDQAREGVSDQLARAMDLIPGEPIVPFTPRPAGVDGLEGSGLGRICVPSTPIRLSELECRAVDRLGSPGVFRNYEADADASRIAVMGGSFPDENLQDLVRLGIDTLVTGEIGYHDMMSLASYGIQVLAVGHDCSERVVLQPVADRLASFFPEIRWFVHPGRDYHLPR